MIPGLRARIELALPPLHGWTTPDKGVRLAELIVESDADSSVEIGVFGGRGTIAMAIGHQTLGHGCVTGIDPWEINASQEGVNAQANDDWWAQVDHDAIYEQFITALVNNGVVRQCRVMREHSLTAVRLFGDRSVDLLHQDGNHSEAISSAEVEIWTPKLRPGGYWIADDTDWPTTRRAQEMLVERRFELLEDHGGWRLYRKP